MPRFAAALDLTQLAAQPASPPSGRCKVYAAADGALRALDSSGTESVVGVMRWARKTADTTRNNTTSLTDDPHLSVPVSANAVYLIDSFLIYHSAGSGPELAVSFTVPSGATLTWVPMGLSPADADQNASQGAGYLRMPATTSGSRSVATQATNAQMVACPRGIVRTGGTAGNLTLQWAQGSAWAENTVLKADSYLTVTRIG